MAIVKVDPLREFAAMQDRMNRLFGNIYLRDEDTGLRGSWMPPVDIFETAGHDLVVRAELPGLTREDIEVSVENGTLVLKATAGSSAPTARSTVRSRCRTRWTPAASLLTSRTGCSR
jgi:HSP20 family protein